MIRDALDCLADVLSCEDMLIFTNPDHTVTCLGCKPLFDDKGLSSGKLWIEIPKAEVSNNFSIISPIPCTEEETEAVHQRLRDATSLSSGKAREMLKRYFATHEDERDEQ